ncbi:MAG: queuosine precursor transporter [Candidatus Izemoplasmataceae bacterium]
MSNEIIWLLFAVANFGLIVISYKLFGKYGLFTWIAMGSILANIQVIKLVELFGLYATLGNIMFGTLFLATDALSEKYGLKDAKKAVYMGFFTLIAMVIIMQFALWFKPALEDGSQNALLTIFGINFNSVDMLRVIIASLSAYFISQLVDVHLFTWIKSKLPSTKLLFVRNIGSTVISQFIDSLIFVPIAFLGALPNDIVLDIFITTYVIKLLVALLDTPFIYLMKFIKPIHE